MMSPYDAMGLLRILSKLEGEKGNKLRVQKVQVLLRLLVMTLMSTRCLKLQP